MKIKSEAVEAIESIGILKVEIIFRVPLTHSKPSGDVVQLVRTLPCHGRGREFESRRPRHILSSTCEDRSPQPWVQKGTNFGQELSSSWA